MLSVLAKFFDPIKPIKDFIYWPMTNKLLPRDYSEVVEFGNELKMTVYQDVLDMVSKTIMLLGKKGYYPWEPQTVDLFINNIKDKETILIAGGHLGYYALIAARANPYASIYVFEPTSKLFERLVKNININDIKNIFPEHKALTEVNQPIEIVVDSGQSSVIKHNGNKDKKIEVIQGISIDSYFDKINRTPDFILLDVEGHEPFVLMGGKKTLAHKPSLIVEINEKMLQRSKSSKENMYSMLESFGYKIKRIESSNERKEMEGDCYNIFCY